MLNPSTGLTQTFTSPVVLSLVNSIRDNGGAGGALTGFIGISSGDAINFRNNANTGDITGLSKDTFDVVQVGGAPGAKVAGPLNIQGNNLTVTVTNDTVTGTTLNCLRCTSRL